VEIPAKGVRLSQWPPQTHQAALGGCDRSVKPVTVDSEDRNRVRLTKKSPRRCDDVGLTKPFTTNERHYA